MWGSGGTCFACVVLFEGTSLKVVRRSNGYCLAKPFHVIGATWSLEKMYLLRRQLAVLWPSHYPTYGFFHLYLKDQRVLSFSPFSFSFGSVPFSGSDLAKIQNRLPRLHPQYLSAMTYQGTCGRETVRHAMIEGPCSGHGGRPPFAFRDMGERAQQIYHTN